MFVREPGSAGPIDSTAEGDISIVGSVHPGLNLYLPLKSPMQMPALAAAIEAVKPTTVQALESLHYVHFARFLPSWDYSALWVITVFDGAYEISDDPDAYEDSLKSYIMDFVATMGDVFTAMLDFVQDAPRLPVNEYPRDFVEFVIRQNRSDVNPWSAYPHMTVIDIQTARSIR